MPLPPAMLFPFELNENNVQVFTGACVLRGWSLFNESPTDEAIASIQDSAGADTVLAAAISLLPEESTREWFSGNGILLRTGALAVINVGIVEGTLYLSPITNADDMSFAFGESGPYFVHGGV